MIDYYEKCDLLSCFLNNLQILCCELLQGNVLLYGWGQTDVTLWKKKLQFYFWVLRADLKSKIQFVIVIDLEGRCQWKVTTLKNT